MGLGGLGPRVHGLRHRLLGFRGFGHVKGLNKAGGKLSNAFLKEVLVRAFQGSLGLPTRLTNSSKGRTKSWCLGLSGRLYRVLECGIVGFIVLRRASNADSLQP